MRARPAAAAARCAMNRSRHAIRAASPGCRSASRFSGPRRPFVLTRFSRARPYSFPARPGTASGRIVAHSPAHILVSSVPRRRLSPATSFRYARSLPGPVSTSGNNEDARGRRSPEYLSFAFLPDRSRGAHFAHSEMDDPSGSSKSVSSWSRVISTTASRKLSGPPASSARRKRSRQQP